jgi:hypothetical protein
MPTIDPETHVFLLIANYTVIVCYSRKIVLFIVILLNYTYSAYVTGIVNVLYSSIGVD